MSELVWIQATGRFETGSVARLGRWRVGCTGYNSAQARGTTTMWSARCMMPGLKDNLGHYATEDEAKNIIEAAVRHWIKGAGLAKVTP